MKSDHELTKTLSEVMKGVDSQVMMCDSASDLLLLAHCMLATSLEIYKTIVGKDIAIHLLNGSIERMKKDV